MTGACFSVKNCLRTRNDYQDAKARIQFQRLGHDSNRALPVAARGVHRNLNSAI